MRTSVLASIAVAACGGGGGDPGTVDEGAARMSIEETGVIVDAMAAADGPMAASGVVDFFAASQLIISPAVRRIGAGPGVRPAIVGSATCTAVVDGMSTCTFDMYGDDTPGSSYTLDGTIVKGTNAYTFDLTYDVALETQTFQWVMTGVLFTSPTYLDGFIELVGTGTTPLGDIDWELRVSYRDVMLVGANRCAYSGSVLALSSYTANGTLVYDIDGSLVLEMVCG